MEISKEKRPVVVIPSNPTKSEVFIAKELIKYIKNIIGTELELCADEKEISGERIIIGSPKRNNLAKNVITQEEFESYVTGSEGFLIKTFGEDVLLLAGKDGDRERGTIYAVYEFLERFAGCSLSAYSHPDVEAGEYVPKKDKIAAENICYAKKSADRPYRMACIQYGSFAGEPDHGLNISFFDWLAKNRYNCIYTWMSVYQKLKKAGLVDAAQERGLDFMVGHHDVTDFFLPPEGNDTFKEKYYETHPEYFRLEKDGTRYKPVDAFGQIVLCSRNGELIKEISKNILTWLEENPEVKMIQLAPHDGVSEHCVCPMCSPYTKMENYTYFMNEVAKLVTEKKPEVKMVMMLYNDIWKCPENVKLSSGMMIIEATWEHPEGLYRGIRTGGKRDGGSLSNTRYEDNILEWKNAGAEVMYYDYYMSVYATKQRYTPLADEIQAIWKRFEEKGILGSSTQIECYNLWNYIFNFFTFGRTGYDSSITLEENLDRFTLIFGEGASWIKKIINETEECLEGQVGIPSAAFYLMDNIDKEKIYDWYEKALESAKTPLARNNIRLMRMVFRYSDISLDFDNARALTGEKVKEGENIPSELLYMNNYDSFWTNKTGYGAAFPITGTVKEEFVPDKWYNFE